MEVVPVEVWLALGAVLLLTGYVLFAVELGRCRWCEAEARRHRGNWDRALARNVQLSLQLERAREEVRELRTRLRDVEALLPTALPKKEGV